MKKELFLFVFFSVLCIGKNVIAIEPGIYWADEYDAYLYHSNLDGSEVAPLFYTGTDTEPRDILIDIQNQNIYWSEWRTQKIRKANIDGTGMSTIIDVGGNGCSGFDIDFDSSQIFWCKASFGANRIMSANLSGSNQKQLVEFTLNHGGASDIVLDISSEKMYWTYYSTIGYSIQRAFLNGSRIETVCSTGRNSRDIELDLAGGKMYWTEYNGYSPGCVRRANLDGTGRQTLIRGLEDPMGLSLDLTSAKMYWTDSELGILQRSNLDGTEVETILSGLNAPRGITIVPVPEPATVSLLAFGGLALLRKRK